MACEPPSSVDMPKCKMSKAAGASGCCCFQFFLQKGKLCSSWIFYLLPLICHFVSCFTARGKLSAVMSVGQNEVLIDPYKLFVQCFGKICLFMQTRDIFEGQACLSLVKLKNQWQRKKADNKSVAHETKTCARNKWKQTWMPMLKLTNIVFKELCESVCVCVNFSSRYTVFPFRKGLMRVCLYKSWWVYKFAR